jgi:ubiquinone biosynthesis protein
MAHLLTLLFEVTELFDMQTRPELVLLQKTMVVVEGVARSYDPRFNMWEAAEPVVRDYILNELGPAAKLREAREGLESLASLARRVPDLAVGLEVLARNMPDLIENGIHINDDDLLELAKESRVAIAVGHAAQIIAALALAVIAWQLTMG